MFPQEVWSKGCGGSHPFQLLVNLNKHPFWGLLTESFRRPHRPHRLKRETFKNTRSRGLSLVSDAWTHCTSDVCFPCNLKMMFKRNFHRRAQTFRFHVRCALVNLTVYLNPPPKRDSQFLVTFRQPKKDINKANDLNGPCIGGLGGSRKKTLSMLKTSAGKSYQHSTCKNIQNYNYHIL